MPYHYIPVTKDTKPEAEQAQIDLFGAPSAVELVVMARYMQVLSADFLERIGCPVINIHHFVPARLRRRRPLLSGRTTAA